jgi:hypothetical protein
MLENILSKRKELNYIHETMFDSVRKRTLKSPRISFRGVSMRKGKPPYI